MKSEKMYMNVRSLGIATRSEHVVSDDVEVSVISDLFWRDLHTTKLKQVTPQKLVFT